MKDIEIKYQFVKKLWVKTRLAVLVSVFAFIGVSLQAYCSQADVIQEVVSHLKSADSRAIASYFDEVVEMDMVSDEKNCPKSEAERILSDFFSKHQLTSLKIIHRIDSKMDYKVVIIVMNTNKGSFRTTISMKNSGNKFLITEMRIENNKDIAP